MTTPTPPSIEGVSGIRPARITPVESRFRHCVHTYHGVNPFSHDDRRLLYLAFDDIADNVGSIVVQDIESGRETVVGSTADFDYHTAAKQFWCFDDQAIMFKTANDKGQIYPVLASADGDGDVQALMEMVGFGFRHVATDGIHAYGGCDGDGDRSNTVVRVNLADRTTEKLFNADDALAVLPDDYASPGEQFVFNHVVCNAAQTKLFCKFLRAERTPADGWTMPGWGVFMVYDLETKNLRSLGGRISGHPSWMSDDQHLVNVMMPLDGINKNRWVVKVNADTGEARRLIDTPIEGPGHPLSSPTDGNLIVTDAFTPDGREAIVYVIDARCGAPREIARLGHSTVVQTSYQPREIVRAHPHPAWSHDGARLVCNCNHDGERMQLLLLDDFLV